MGSSLVRRCSSSSSSSSAVVLRPCAGCQALHPASHFAAPQLARAPEARRCRGSDGVLRVCPHLAFTYAQMRDVLERAREEAPPEAAKVDVQCGECPRARLRSYPRGPAFRDGYRRQAYCIEQEVELEGLVVEGGSHDGGGGVGDGGGGGGGGDGGRLVVSTRTDFTLDVTLRVLRTVAERHDVFLCNHIRLGEPQTFVTRVLASHRRAAIISMHDCRLCSASAVLRDSLFTGINLKIQRSFSVNSPTDKQWLAQIQSS
ncbi:hypothetical protein B0J12DRAFT_668593 [Macrophomina phaseolina]|uniref:Uncharacterized protein n=1 Tax=Macrophomina phaseolina TaxID=35725 RepID=A0ABQ8G7C3_9PEZI|nr:hypothetical protein B0J12DRAFT_668593 [Macrophomina phaseolina]